jgi:putative ABC transport system substrate-binding protein
MSREARGVSEFRRRKNMSKNFCFWSLVITLLAIAGTSEAQQPKRIYRIGYLASSNPAAEADRVEAIRLALRDRGYIEGQIIFVEYRYADGNLDRAREILAELVRSNVDLILVAGGTIWVQAAKNATKTIPVVMTGAGLDPVEEGIIESLARPGGNITGFTDAGKELGGKRLELLKETVPKLSRVAVLYDPAMMLSVLEVKDVFPVSARAMRLAIHSQEVRSADEFDKAFAAVNKQRPGALYVSGGPLIRANTKRIVAFALKSRLPSIYYNKDSVVAGGLMYYGADAAESYRRVAYFVDRILKGAKPADLPVEQPMKFEFIINLKTAKQIGLEIPQWTLMKADRVIR